MGILLVYDVTDEKSFNSALHCRHIQNEGSPQYYRHQDMAREHRAARLGRRQQDPHRQQIGLDGQTCGDGRAGPGARGGARHQVHGDFGEGQRGRRGGVLYPRAVGLSFLSLLTRSFPSSSPLPFSPCSRFGTQPPHTRTHTFPRDARDIKTRLIDSQADASAAAAGPQSKEGAVNVTPPASQTSPGCCA